VKEIFTLLHSRCSNAECCLQCCLCFRTVFAGLKARTKSRV